MKSAVLLFSCPDQKGIVAGVTGFIFEQGGNVLHAEEHLEDESGLFLMRVEFDFDKETGMAEFSAQFKPLAEKLKMEWQLFDLQKKPEVAILVSKQLHCLADLLFRYENSELPCRIGIIISNHPDARELADFYGIPFFTVNNDKSAAESKITKLLKEHEIELVVLARYMQILSAGLVERYPNRIINIHHSFLPAFIGAKPYHQAHQRGVKLVGATSHYVTPELDLGPIIEQDVLRISHRDSAPELVQKGQDVEKVVLFRAIKWHLQRRVLIFKGKTVVFN